MGYFLLFESMLDTVIYARDRWSAPESRASVYPDLLTMKLEASGDMDLYQDNVQYWKDVYGFSMSCMKELVLREAAVDSVKAKEIITDAVVIKVKFFGNE